MISKIELRPQAVGYRMIDGVEEIVEADFWVLLVDDKPGGGMRQVGYCWKAAGSPINLIRRLSDADLVTLHELVQAEVGDRMKPVQPPPPLSQDDDEGDDGEA